MTVRENVLVGSHARRGEHGTVQILEYVGLASIAGRRVRGLPFGTLKRVELARALASGPRLLLLDEPAGGLNHEEVTELAEFIRNLHQEFELTILLVEHHMALVMGLADRVHVLDFGRTIASGTPREVQETLPSSRRTSERPPERSAARARAGIRPLRRVRALHGVSLAVEEGQIVSVLGPNGAGKTTTLRAVSGMVRTSGSIVYAGKRIGRSPEGAARAGIAHVPEGRGTFTELSVWENLRLGAYTVREPDFDDALAYFPWLSERRQQQAGTLSGGEQQMLALARALVARPRLLLLDEPSLGLAPLVVREIFGIVRRLNEERGLTVLVVEQNAVVALDSSHAGYVLEAGRMALAGTSAELRADESIRRSYLGY